MNTTYQPLPKIQPNGITLLLGSSTGSNIDASLSHAIELVKSQPSGSVLYLNTVQDTRSMFLSARKQGLDPDGNGLCHVDGDVRKVIYILNVTRGDLYRWRDTIKEFLYMGYIQYVMVNSWEFSSKNSRYREEAVFFIKEITEGLEGGYQPMHALIYAEEIPSKPLVQKIQRNGFGKLTGLTQTVHSISVKEQFEKSDAIDKMLNLPEVKQMAEFPPAPVWTDEDLTITLEEIERRVAARKKEIDKNNIKEWYERKLKKEAEASAKIEVPQPEEKEQEQEDSPIVQAIITSMEELRKTPEAVSKMPIHLNSYSPIKAPVMRPSKSEKINGGMKIK